MVKRYDVTSLMRYEKRAVTLEKNTYSSTGARRWSWARIKLGGV